jgi:hypothetical protein
MEEVDTQTKTHYYISGNRSCFLQQNVGPRLPDVRAGVYLVVLALVGAGARRGRKGWFAWAFARSGRAFGPWDSLEEKRS